MFAPSLPPNPPMPSFRPLYPAGEVGDQMHAERTRAYEIEWRQYVDMIERNEREQAIGAISGVVLMALMLGTFIAFFVP